MTEIITLTISKELRDKIDLTRGDIPRSKFISRSLETFFNNRGQKENPTQSNSKVLYSSICRNIAGLAKFFKNSWNRAI